MRIVIKTMGCKSNRYESEKLKKLLSVGGFDVIELNQGVSTFQRMNLGSDNFDYFILNSCTVTHVADRKSRQALRSFKKAYPNCEIIVYGCGANVSEKEYEAMKEVDYVFTDIDDIIDFLMKKDSRLRGNDRGQENDSERRNDRGQADDSERGNDRGQEDDSERGNDSEKCDNHSLFNDNDSRTRAVVKIQDGCNNYCTYCIIPRARGREISYPLNQIVKEVKEKEKAGFKEIVLTGIIIGKWKENGMDLADLIQKLIDETETVRFRLSSLEPENFSDKFINLFKTGRLCPHIHMSLQSGSDSVLMRMRRNYDTSLYYEVSEKFKKAVPDISFTTDVIVGFPGETKKEFEETCEFVKKIGFLKLHVFPFSRRKNTPAYYMPNQISDNVKKKRGAFLRMISDELYEKYLSNQLNREFEILVESRDEQKFIGLTPNYIPVQIFCSEYKGVKLNNFLKVKLDKINKNGEMIGLVK